jgi:hypothetical protein
LEVVLVAAFPEREKRVGEMGKILEELMATTCNIIEVIHWTVRRQVEGGKLGLSV